MADHLYLNLWFPSFTEAEMMPRLLCVLQNFPFAGSSPGPNYVGVYSIGWDEPAVFEESFESYATPEHVLELAAEVLHDDNAYVVDGSNNTIRKIRPAPGRSSL